MKYVVFETGGKQYRVSKGDILVVDKIPTSKENTVVFDSVLLSVEDNVFKLGTPKVSDVLVKATILGEVKGEKIHVVQYKAKVRHRRRIGFRSQLTQVKIDSIQSKGEKVETKVNSALKEKKSPSQK